MAERKTSAAGKVALRRLARHAFTIKKLEEQLDVARDERNADVRKCVGDDKLGLTAREIGDAANVTYGFVSQLKRSSEEVEPRFKKSATP